MYKILGYTDGVHVCDCCGKSDLKGTFSVERNDGEILYFGSVCVTRHTGKSSKVVRAEAKKAYDEKVLRARVEYRNDFARITYEAKHAQHAKAGILGKALADACRAERAAMDDSWKLIAEKHGVDIWDIRS